MASRPTAPASRKVNPATREAGRADRKICRPCSVRHSTNRSSSPKMVGGKKSASSKPSSISWSTNRPTAIGAPSNSCSISFTTSSAGQSRKPLMTRSAGQKKRSSSSSKLGSFAKKESPMIKDLTPAEYKMVLRQDFASFMGRCFYDLNPLAELLMSCYHEGIASKLMAVRQGRIKRLIINLPPRHVKSLMASIAFPAWCLGHDPSAQILCVSYAQDLADKFARDCRGIMMSPWYQRIFATRLAARRLAVQEFVTTRQGYRLATSTGGVLTGRGADIILIDDPLKPEDAQSKTLRQGCNEWFLNTLYSRLNDKRTGAILLIMQRLHEDDLVGHVLGLERWEVLSFPAIAEQDEEHRIETIWGSRSFPAGRGVASRSRAAGGAPPHPADDW